MFSELRDDLEIFLQEKIWLTPRRYEILARMSDRMPPSWAQALSSMEIATSIELIWQPMSGFLNNLIDYLKQETIELALVSSSTHQPIGLAYIFRYIEPDDNEIFISWLGGLPVNEAKISQYELESDIQLPQSYKKFLYIHNGFLQDGMPSLGIRPMNKLYYISEIIENSGDLNYNPNRLLGFCGDGAGNEQCFDLTSPINRYDCKTVDWDHETQQISKPQTFWDFFEQLVVR